MFVKVVPAGLSSKKRDLHQDDIDGVCHIYPYDRETPDKVPIQLEVAGGCEGCKIASTPVFSARILGLFLFVLLILRFRR